MVLLMNSSTNENINVILFDEEYDSVEEFGLNPDSSVHPMQDYSDIDPDVKPSIIELEDGENHYWDVYRLGITLGNGLEISKYIRKDETSVDELKKIFLEFIDAFDTVIEKKLYGKVRCKYCKSNPCKCFNLC